MLSVNLNLAKGFKNFDPMTMGLPGLNTLSPTTTLVVAPAAVTPASNSNSVPSAMATEGAPIVPEDPNKKVRKPYTITKSRESWTEPEHDKFIEALQLFDRDWKKIEAFVGSKTVIQIRSHAQKYFLKVQKSGTSERVPPPRPKRKAAHPYPQKAPKAPLVSQVTVPESNSEPEFIYRPDSSAALGSPVTNVPLSSWSYNIITPVNVSQPTKDDRSMVKGATADNCCFSSSNKNTPKSQPNGKRMDQGNLDKSVRVTPDFAQVYSFIGSAFDPNVTDQLQRLKQMNPINMETILLLMRNLSVNLMSPEFEDDRTLLSSYNPDIEKANSGSPLSDSHSDKSDSLILPA